MTDSRDRAEAALEAAIRRAAQGYAAGYEWVGGIDRPVLDRISQLAREAGAAEVDPLGGVGIRVGGLAVPRTFR